MKGTKPSPRAMFTCTICQVARPTCSGKHACCSAVSSFVTELYHRVSASASASIVSCKKVPCWLRSFQQRRGCLGWLPLTVPLRWCDGPQIEIAYQTTDSNKCVSSCVLVP